MADTSGLEKKFKRRKRAEGHGYLSTGSTLLNLALTGRPNDGYKLGHYYLYVGDSQSGKTVLAITSLTEAANSPRFKDYRLVFDDVEKGAEMDWGKFWGDAAKRIGPPHRHKGEPVHSATMEEFYQNVEEIADAGPCVYVIDSLDALKAEDDLEQIREERKAREKGKAASGSYGTAKAKLHSSNLPVLINKLAKNGSLLIAISQTRDTIGFNAQFNPKTRSGGKALKFYAHGEVWTAVREKLKVRARGEYRINGTLMECRVKKNRSTGTEPTVYVPIYHSTGIHDTRSLIYFLIDEKHWKGTDSTVIAPEFDFDGRISDLSRKIIEEGSKKDVISIVVEVWNEIQAACEVEQERRYA